MRIFLALLVVCITCPAGFAEYPELTAMKESSRKALTEYAGKFAADDAKFEGLIKFGEALKTVADPAKADVAKLTYQSKAYWRAVLETTPQDSSILLAQAHLHAARGERNYADAYFLLASVTMDKSRREELAAYTHLRDALNARAGQEIEKGIKLHDAGQYTKAIEVYDAVLAEYPACSQAYYEKGYSYLMMGKSGAAAKKKAEAMYAECRRLDPFWWKAYQGGGPAVVKKLQVCMEKVQPFVSGKERTKAGFIAFAEGCEAMELYPFAAHARWKLAMMDPDHMREHVKAFLDMIEKCGCEDPAFFRRQFQFDENKPIAPADSGSQK
jgi:tetratricopeptide (TPR) repeat protein